ncbi:hypothetical protein XI03_02405 [Bradyrhizobium sp. CCBAU 65884]|uniref:helix-turn-helix domain-containing protein n=1 Tax=Bradyrhizobium sp. CCBAU 65884 TaxID=722477 RepID=UPI003FA468D8|nr:hypothetical protein [Bradyrhizobium sp. CCBAU 65884]
MTVLSMSRAEIDRVHVLRDVVAERIAVRVAAQLLRVTSRQAFRLLKAYRIGGPAALLSKKRGKPATEPIRWRPDDRPRLRRVEHRAIRPA